MTHSATSPIFSADATIEHGVRTLALAIEGLQAVSDSLDSRFVACVDMITHMQGRLIVTGMGKSGHIARKIAATFASTGTPAHFVHPAEASHGDMGMITSGDVVMMLSNSGETAELSEMIAYCKRFSIPLIALVRRTKSMLVDVADIAIILPEIAEGSPIGAPTTSTMMMLAYGDALAVAVLQKKGFTKEAFGVLHPGGKLGKALMRVRDLMHTGNALPLVSLQDTMAHVLMVMTQKSLGCAIVVQEDGSLAGMITDGDLRRHLGSDFIHKTANDIMTVQPQTTTPHTLVAEVLHILNSRAITSLIVVEGMRPVGVIHIHDCLRAGVA